MRKWLLFLIIGLLRNFLLMCQQQYEIWQHLMKSNITVQLQSMHSWANWINWPGENCMIASTPKCFLNVSWPWTEGKSYGEVFSLCFFEARVSVTQTWFWNGKRKSLLINVSTPSFIKTSYFGCLLCGWAMMKSRASPIHFWANSLPFCLQKKVKYLPVVFVTQH